VTRTARWLVGLAVGLVALFVGAILVLTLIVDPNSYRDEIEGAVRQATARDFRLQGNIDIAWFPWLALEAGPAELGNPDGFPTGPPLLKWNRANVGIRALPLLRRELIVDRVRLQGLEAHLRVAADGRKNWERLLDDQGEARGAATGAPSIPRNAGIEIRDGALEYSDARTGRRVGISDWTLDVGAFDPGEPVALRTEFRYRDVPIVLREDDLTVDLDPLRVDAPAWTLQIGEARLDGALRSTDRLETIEGSVRGSVPSLRALLVAFGLSAPRTRDAAAIGALRLTGSWRYDDGALSVKPLELSLDETALRGTLSRSAPDDANTDGLWLFELSGDRIDLDRYREPEEAAESKPFELPVEQLKAANVRGTITFANARLAGMDAKDVKLSVSTDEPAK
jgi:AsmA protein